MEMVDTRDVTRLEKGKEDILKDKVALEQAITLYIDKREVTTFLCSPLMVNELAIGFLLSEGWIRDKDDIKDIGYNSVDGIVYVTLKKGIADGMNNNKGSIITSGCGRGIGTNFLKRLKRDDMIKSNIRISSNKIHNIMKEFTHLSLIYRETGGVHSSALWDGDKIVVFAEDLGRHNAVDKIFGYSFTNNIDTRDKILLTSGRVSSEILIKCVKRYVPIVISRNAPTALAVDMAILLGITLVGFVRGERMNIYAWRERIG